MMNSEHKLTGRRLRHGFMALLLCLSLILPVSCSRQKNVHLLSRFGEYGSDIARHIASLYPSRPAGSEAERQTGDYIKMVFEDLGYETEEQHIYLGNGTNSRNIIVRIPGFGFTADPDTLDAYNYDVYARRAKAEDGLFRRQVIVGARYDSDPEAPEAADGISDNASGVAALLQLARWLKRVPVGYDVILVAFGAGFSGETGAVSFAASLDEEARQITDCFYEFRSLYAGGKLYANAGWSSIYPGYKYILRQPAYEVADLSIREPIYRICHESLYQNQSTYKIPNPLADETPPAGMRRAASEVVFREIPKMVSDFRAFDRLAIPCVIFESYDYSADSFEELKENVDPNFASSDYRVRGTEFDNVTTLDEFVGEESLTNRINAASYLVYAAIKSGALGGVNHID